MKKSKEKVLTLIPKGIMYLLVGIFITSLVIERIRPHPWAPPVQHYTYSLATGFQTVWSVNDAFDGSSSNINSIVLTATPNKIFFLGDFDPYEPNKNVQVLNTLTGQVESKISVQLPNTIASDDSALYVGIASKGKILPEMVKGAAQVVAYDIESEKTIWAKPIRGARSIGYISTFGHSVFVIGSTVASARYQYLNSANGQTQYSDDVNYPVFYTGDTWYIIQPPSRLRAIQNGSNTPLWERRFDTEAFSYSSVYFAPVLDNGIIVGRTGEGVGRAYALDSTTGQLLWRSEDVVYGNIVASQGVTFFLTEQAELKAVNSRTGQALATVIFEPETPQEQLTQGGRVYNMAVSGDIVVVYFGDSRQLFAFRFVR